MKIKIIDLLNKIANNEEVPKKIKWQGQVYEYSCSNRFYYQNSWSMYRDFYTEGNCLNDYVEIIEEPKKTEKISWSEKESLAGEFTANEKQNILARRTEKLKSSLNELIDEINNLKEKK